MLQGEMVAERLRKDWSFTPVPSVVLRDKTIPDSEKITYQYLIDHAGTKGHCWVSQKRLAKDRGKGLRTIERHISTLKSMGLIRVRPGTISSDTSIVSISFLYKQPKVRYKGSERNPDSIPIRRDPNDKNDGKNDGEIPDKNGGWLPDKNGGHKEKKVPLEEIKPDTSYPGGLPSGQPQSTEENSFEERSSVVDFYTYASHASFLTPEVREMSLKTPRRQQGKPKKVPPKKATSERVSVDPHSGEQIGGKKKPKRVDKMKKKVHELWSEWKFRIRGTFHVPLPGRYPRGSDYGHLKNILLYVDGDYDYALRLLSYIIDRWDEVKKGNFRAERMNEPTLYLLDALKNEIHANIQSGRTFQPKPETPKKKQWSGGINRHAKDHSGFEEEEERQWAEWEKKFEGKDKKSGT